MNNEWEAKLLSKKDLDAKKLQGPHFLIQTPTTRVLHPDYPVPVPITEKDRILELLCCHADVKLSARVMGREREVAIVGTDFYPCSNETYPEVNALLRERFPTHRFNNPFPSSLEKGLVDGKYKSCIRSIWSVREFTDVKKEASFGVIGPGGSERLKICYKDGQLGVAVCYDTGRKETRSTLEAVRSMYRNPM